MTIFFPDLSNHNTATVEPATAAVLAKATEGSSFTDPTYARHKQEAHAVGAVFGAYHWLWSADDAEVAHCRDVVGDTPLMLDCENLKVVNTVKMIETFTVKYRNAGGTVFLMYLPHWYWQDHMGAPSLKPLDEIGLNLVSSNYTRYSDNGPGWDPYGGMTPVQWQYSDNTRYGGDGAVDFNAFKGSQADYGALLNGGHTDMPLTPDDLDKIETRIFRHIVTTDGSNDVGFNELLRGLRTRSLALTPEALAAAIKLPGITSAQMEQALRDAFAALGQA
jgi:hypothetical protein